jgi:hypothetical protein
VSMRVHSLVKGEQQDMDVGKGEEGNNMVLRMLMDNGCTIHRWRLDVWVVVCCGTNKSIHCMRHPGFVLAKWYRSWCIRYYYVLVS